MKKEQYQPTEEEVKKAEEMMSEDQEEKSEERESIIKATPEVTAKETQKAINEHKERREELEKAHMRKTEEQKTIEYWSDSHPENEGPYFPSMKKDGEKYVGSLKAEHVFDMYQGKDYRRICNPHIDADFLCTNDGYTSLPLVAGGELGGVVKYLFEDKVWKNDID